MEICPLLNLRTLKPRAFALARSAPIDLPMSPLRYLVILAPVLRFRHPYPTVAFAFILDGLPTAIHDKKRRYAFAGNNARLLILRMALVKPVTVATSGKCTPTGRNT